MELQQLRYVVAVAEESNFTRAAAKCFVVQSALSHQVKALEAELGVRLFARTSRRVELTPAGAAFLPAARASLEAAERAAAEASAAAGQVRGRLTVGVIPTVTAIDVPRVLAAFHRAHPEVGITMRVAASDVLQTSIARSTIDVGFLGLPDGQDPKGVAWRLLGSDRLVIVLPREHALADAQCLRLSELVGEVFADFPSGTPGRAQSDLAFEAAGLERHVAFEVMATDLMMALVRANLAITFLPSRFVPEDPGLATVPVVDGPARSEYLAWSDFNPSPAARAFLARVEDMTPPDQVR
ncbi:LysR substrate-binding domain-containing protein [Ruania halotolerans]|uniref:LysR substrate-binding domain-containing protein n=1 Tax=Ruania halotolerans TaxID=2897773 RepID=UPI001E4C1EF3|nr:LysR substrate-binding domain-containing protein [Ruania halotolerans]UFU05595.1 LysR substrate-binding domain-containing protein [Ruania halotolerans]